MSNMQLQIKLTLRDNSSTQLKLRHNVLRGFSALLLIQLCAEFADGLIIWRIVFLKIFKSFTITYRQI